MHKKLVEFLKKHKIYAIYTVIFLLMAIIIFFMFWIKKISFIWLGDGIEQHYIILKDFNEIIRNFLSSPKGGIKLFSWEMGLGLDIIGQYSYYIIGDPFAYISLLFPMDKLDVAYSFLILLRMFFIGISFIVYARYNNKKDTNILLGAICYTFSAFTLFAGLRHPYFLNAAILFPLLLLGVDKLLRENKKIFLCILVTISAISNYYFFYMHTVMLVIYAGIKYLCEYRKDGIKGFLKKLGAGIYIYIIAILIASIVLLPTAYAFLNSPRTEEKHIIKYTADYYQSIFTTNLLSVNEEYYFWSYIRSMCNNFNNASYLMDKI